jgi:hypothetical protein
MIKCKPAMHFVLWNIFHLNHYTDNVQLVFFIFKYNQRDATLHNSFVSAKPSTCFRRFLRPSSGTQKLYIQHLVFVKPLLLPFAVVEELELEFQLLHDSER